MSAAVAKRPNKAGPDAVLAARLRERIYREYAQGLLTETEFVREMKALPSYEPGGPRGKKGEQSR